jgi:hypothetical protein
LIWLYVLLAAFVLLFVLGWILSTAPRPDADLEALVAGFEKPRSSGVNPACAPVPILLPQPIGLVLQDLNTAYSFKEPKADRSRLAWRPITVFDDGERTYLALPPEASRGELPVLLGRLASGETYYPLNPTLHEDWWVVPTVFAEAELRLGPTGNSRWLRVQSDRLAAPKGGR